MILVKPPRKRHKNIHNYLNTAPDKSQDLPGHFNKKTTIKIFLRKKCNLQSILVVNL